MTVDLSKYSTGSFQRGASALKELLWIVISLVFFRLCPLSFSSFKCFLLRCFGSRIGCGVVIKPGVKITFPWKLEIGDHVWLGEECWLLNLAPITIGSHVCISQRAFLCTGNHNFKSPTFDLIVQPIVVQNGAWIGAASFVGPGVTFGTNAVLTAGSIISKNLDPSGIYRGNPASCVRKRGSLEAFIDEHG